MFFMETPQARQTINNGANPQIIGEGTYGCVAKPSFTCKGKKRNYSNKVSKVMLHEDAKAEYKEMKSITKIKGIEKYITSMPEMCIPEIDSKYRMAMKDCENERFVGALEGDFRLLIMEDGGVSLRQFMDEIIETLDHDGICIFLTKIYHLIEGLQFFANNNIVHHDIKSRNVVYNIETNTIKYIDFGLTKKKNQLIQESMKNKNLIAQEWDNFPPEYDIANKYHFALYGKYRYNMNYNTFIKKVADTLDSYSFGLMMKRIMEEFMKIDLDIDIEAIQEIHYFFEKMADPKIETRNYEINHLMTEYKMILEEYKLWNTNKPNPSKQSVQIQKSLSKSVDMSIEERKTLKMALDPYRNLKPCREDQERNPLTRRCVKKCKKDYVRNEKYKCVKTRKQKQKPKPKPKQKVIITEKDSWL